MKSIDLELDHHALDKWLTIVGYHTWLRVAAGPTRPELGRVGCSCSHSGWLALRLMVYSLDTKRIGALVSLEHAYEHAAKVLPSGSPSINDTFAIVHVHRVTQIKPSGCFTMQILDHQNRQCKQGLDVRH